MFESLKRLGRKATIGIAVTLPLAVAGSLAKNALSVREMGHAIKMAWLTQKERVRVEVMIDNLILRSELEDLVVGMRKETYLTKLTFFELLAYSCSKAIANIPESYQDFPFFEDPDEQITNDSTTTLSEIEEEEKSESNAGVAGEVSEQIPSNDGISADR